MKMTEKQIEIMDLWLNDHERDFDVHSICVEHQGEKGWVKKRDKNGKKWMFPEVRRLLSQLDFLGMLKYNTLFYCPSIKYYRPTMKGIAYLYNRKGEG